MDIQISVVYTNYNNKVVPSFPGVKLGDFMWYEYPAYLLTTHDSSDYFGWQAVTGWEINSQPCWTCNYQCTRVESAEEAFRAVHECTNRKYEWREEDTFRVLVTVNGEYFKEALLLDVWDRGENFSHVEWSKSNGDYSPKTQQEIFLQILQETNWDSLPEVGQELLEKALKDQIAFLGQFI